MAQNNSLNYQTVQYNLLVGDVNNNISNISPSTSGFICQSNGSSSNPNFVVTANSGDSWVELQTQTAASSSNIVFTSSVFTGTYKAYVLVMKDIVLSTSTVFNMKFSTDNGSTYKSTFYASSNQSIAYNSTTYANQTSSSVMQIYNSASGVTNGVLYMFGLGLIGITSIFGTFLVAQQSFQSSFCANAASNVNNILLSGTTGFITSGTFTLYGITQ